MNDVQPENQRVHFIGGRSSATRPAKLGVSLNMNIAAYSNEYFDGCMEIFDSNMPKYFAEWEREKFSTFLSTYAIQDPFFLLLNRGKVVGCGGYEVNQGSAELTWGMVHSSQHRNGFGATLLKYRVGHIYSNVGRVQIKVETSQHTEEFFKRYGFETIGKVNSGYCPGLHQVQMLLGAKS